MSSFPQERMARIKDTTCGSSPLFSLATLFSLPGNDEKCSRVFIVNLLYLSSLSVLSLVTLLPPSFSSSYSFPSTSIFVFWGRLPNAKALKIVLLSLLGNKGESTRMDFAEISAKCFWDCAEEISGKDITMIDNNPRNQLLINFVRR